MPATKLLGDLPIALDETGRVSQPVDWVDFVDFMKRLEHHLGGLEELEDCGEQICRLGPSSILHTLVGLSASPYSLYRAASQWALRRAIPGIQSSIKEVSPNRIEIRVHLSKGMRPCPQLFQLATGSARALPRILRLSDAVVTARIDEFEASYQITVPASRTPWARLTRLFRTVASARSVLGFLETQQLELHAKHEELELTRAALAASERRHKTLTEAAVDVLCELDQTGHIVYVSASVMDLIGYTPEQVTGSHFSLWVPGEHRNEARARFEAFANQSLLQAVTRLRVQLQTETGGHIVAELSLRPYRTAEGEIRMVLILRDETDRLMSRSRDSKSKRQESERNAMDALRDRVEVYGATTTRHPIERSLALLLASLEASTGNLDDHEMERMIASTDRMTQIVDRVMASSDASASNFRWHEFEKFIERLRSDFYSTPRNAGRMLRIKTTKAPALLWTEDALLVAGLESLLDWATERSSPEAELHLEVAGIEEFQNGTRMLVFSVGSASTDHTEREDTASSNLALATAKDTASALDGDLTLERVRQGGQIGRIRIPQPSEPAN